MESRSVGVPVSRNTISLRLHSQRVGESGNDSAPTATVQKTTSHKAGPWRKNSFLPRLFHSRRSAATAPPMLETSSPRCNPCARLVNWSVKNALTHPLTQQSLCPPPLRGKLHTNFPPGHEYGMQENGSDYHQGRFSDEELSSGDEEDLLSAEKDGTSGKLAFGRRKLKFFDQITAADYDAARSSVKSYWREVYQRRFQAKLRHMQTGSSEDDVVLFYAFERETGVGDVDFPKSKEDSSSILAAFIIESLTINRHESLEGMAECYDGLVAAGTALLQHEEQNRSNRSNTGGSAEPEWNASDPMAVLSTLSPLLITTLEPMSGEAILQLSKLYNLCATSRYKRRLVHRIAPHLVRPPYAAMWCLKHHNDMASILTVTEFLMDHAKDIFSPQWHERGKFLKADGRRAHSLRLAALQLKNLHKKENMLQLLATKSGTQNVTGYSAEVEHGLAEWEILAVDRCIRTSIRNVFERQWVTPKVAKHPHAPIGRTLHHHTGLPSTSLSSTGVGGCPMSPRKIPFGSGPFSSSNNPTSTAGVQYVVDSGMTLAASTPPSTSLPIEIPVTPKSLNAAVSNTTVHISGSPLRSPSSPPKSSRSLLVDSSLGALINAPPFPNALSNHQTSTGVTVARRITQPAFHQTLTKSAEERKRTVAACRALRAQINRFEEAFFQIHHRQPKGATERAPLATTYAQYREWKRAIRADAATRIQAFFRGARCRWTMLRSSSPRMSKIVRTVGSNRGKGVFKQLSIPGDSGESHSGTVIVSSGVDGDNKSVQSGYGMEVEERSCVSTEGVELIINTAKRRIGLERNRAISKIASPPSGGTSWHLGRSLRRTEKQKEPGDVAKAHLLSPLSIENSATASVGLNDSATRGTQDKKNLSLALMHPKKSSKYAKIHGSSCNSLDSDDSDNSHSSKGSYSTNSQTASLGDLSLSDLVSQKRDLKAQLKSYDLNFAREHGRMPVKAEKEPIRHLYEQYNALKAHITMLEAGGAPKSGQQSGNISHHQPAALGGNILSSNRKQQSQLNAPYFSSSDKSLGSEGSEDSVNRSTSGERRQRNSSISTASDVISLGLGADLSVTGLHLPDDIRALKEEKGNLHQMLRNYEKDFFKEHNRQVSSFADIRPVAAQYRRYKEIKRAIATLQAVDR